MNPKPDACELCGERTRALRPRLVHRPEQPPGMQWDHAWACIDRDGCESRSKVSAGSQTHNGRTP